jgi:hypothetical protein
MKLNDTMGSLGERSNDLAVAVPPHDAGEADTTAESVTGLHQRRAVVASTTNADEHNISATSAGPPPVDVETAISKQGQGHGKDVNNDVQTAANGAAAQAEEEYAEVSYVDITKQFFILGWTAFGGPAAHIGLFQKVLTCWSWYVCNSQLMSLWHVIAATSRRVSSVTHYWSC